MMAVIQHGFGIDIFITGNNNCFLRGDGYDKMEEKTYHNYNNYSRVFITYVANDFIK